MGSILAFLRKSEAGGMQRYADDVHGTATRHHPQSAPCYPVSNEHRSSRTSCNCLTGPLGVNSWIVPDRRSAEYAGGAPPDARWFLFAHDRLVLVCARPVGAGAAREPAAGPDTATRASLTLHPPCVAVLGHFAMTPCCVGELRPSDLRSPLQGID